MSAENLKEYARRCATEPELLAKAKAIGLHDTAEHMRLASSLGLDWSMDDLVAFQKEMVEAEGDVEDLSEENLEQVAGGLITITAAVVTAAAVGGAVAGGVAAGATTSAVVTAGDGW